MKWKNKSRIDWTDEAAANATLLCPKYGADGTFDSTARHVYYDVANDLFVFGEPSTPPSTFACEYPGGKDYSPVSNIGTSGSVGSAYLPTKINDNDWRSFDGTSYVKSSSHWHGKVKGDWFFFTFPEVIAVRLVLFAGSFNHDHNYKD